MIDELDVAVRVTAAEYGAADEVEIVFEVERCVPELARVGDLDDCYQVRAVFRNASLVSWMLPRTSVMMIPMMPASASRRKRASLRRRARAALRSAV